MITDELSTGIIEAVKTKLPQKDNLANTLMDILYIGKEATYRRLRGEVPFTLAEAAILSRKLGISLDTIIGTSFRENAVFDMNIVDYQNPFKTYFTILDRYVKLFHTIKGDTRNFIEHHSTDSFNEARYTFQIQAIQMDVPKRKHEMQAFR